MVVERTINVGFHSNFGMFKRSRHSKIPTRLAITLLIRSLLLVKKPSFQEKTRFQGQWVYQK